MEIAEIIGLIIVAVVAIVWLTSIFYVIWKFIPDPDVVVDEESTGMVTQNRFVVDIYFGGGITKRSLYFYTQESGNILLNRIMAKWLLIRWTTRVNLDNMTDMVIVCEEESKTQEWRDAAIELEKEKVDILLDAKYVLPSND